MPRSPRSRQATTQQQRWHSTSYSLVKTSRAVGAAPATRCVTKAFRIHTLLLKIFEQESEKQPSGRPHAAITRLTAQRILMGMGHAGEISTDHCIHVCPRCVTDSVFIERSLLVQSGGVLSRLSCRDVKGATNAYLLRFGEISRTRLLSQSLAPVAICCSSLD